MNERLRQYIFEGGATEVNGVCSAEVMQVINQFHDFQVEHDVTGDLVEIGVYEGRLFIMLALLARPGERAVAIDVFERGVNYDPGGGSTSLETVQMNHNRFVGDTAPFFYIAEDSLFLTPEVVKQNLQTGHVRIFSIDGAHSSFHTLHDMRLAGDLVCPGGIVFVDDITNSGWPGVMEGVARYFLLGPEQRLFPFMMSLNKLWLTTYTHHSVYLDLAINNIQPGHERRITNFFGSNIVGW